MEPDNILIKSLLRTKNNLALIKNTFGENNFTKLPLCYIIDKKKNRNYSYNNKNRMRNIIKNDNSITNYPSSNTNENKKIKVSHKLNLSNKKSNINKLKTLKNKLKIIKIPQYSTLSVKRNYNKLNQNKKPKNKLIENKFKKIDIKDFNIKPNNKSYIANKTPKNQNKILLSKKLKIKNKDILKDENSKIIMVKKNKQFLEKSQTLLNVKEDKNFSFSDSNNHKKIINIKNEDYNIKENKNILLYKKKKIMNKQFLLRLNIINDAHNNIIPSETIQYTNNVNNYDFYNILTKTQENTINNNQHNYNINNYMNKEINKCLLEKEKNKEQNSNRINYSEKNNGLGIDTNHYNVKNININFNNIKVVNNISKKNTSLENNKKRKIINNNINHDTISLNNEEEIMNQIEENEEGKSYSKHKIKVCKTKSSLKIPEDIKINTKIMKRKIIKGKSDHFLKIKKPIKIMKIDSCTIEGKSFKQKYNQENFFMKEQFLNQKEQFLIGISNGHGKHGKLISKFIINLLPQLITDTSDNKIINSYIEMNKQIINENNKTFDCSLSGSSCISLIISLEKIISANLGDNKAILARYENGLYNFINLNREHKPILSDEKKRILENNGKIGHLFETTNSPKKIYLKNSDIPGLSISRSFGDTIAHSVGVISEPEVKTFYYNGNEKFIILANHTFWDIIDSEETIEIVRDFYEDNMDAIGALNKLAVEILNKNENEHKPINGDITIIIIFFE